jgi:Uma2 family endonuclease
MVVTSNATMKQSTVRFNYQDYLQLPEDKRYEILDGDLYVVPAPNTRHQRISKRIHFALMAQIEAKGLGEIFNAPFDVVFSDENIAQPDLLFICRERLGLLTEANLAAAPDLAVEILSPGTRQKDLAIKRKIYARFGVREYWIVDPEANTVEVLVWRKSGYAASGIFGEAEHLVSPLLPELVLPLDKVFAK